MDHPGDAGAPYDDDRLAFPGDGAGLLLDRAAAGDHDAAARVYDELAGPVYRVVLSVVGEPAAAETVCQEVFREVWATAPHRSPRRAPARGWVLLVAHRCATDRVRRHRGGTPLRGSHRVLPSTGSRPSGPARPGPQRSWWERSSSTEAVSTASGRPCGGYPPGRPAGGPRPAGNRPPGHRARPPTRADRPDRCERRADQPGRSRRPDQPVEVSTSARDAVRTSRRRRDGPARCGWRHGRGRGAGARRAEPGP